MFILSNFSESLSELMSERNLTADALSKAIDVDSSTIGYWKRGKYKLHLSNALKLANYFECSLEFLLGRTETRLSYTPKICPPFYERLKQLMSDENISGYALVKNTKFHRGHLHRWKNGADPLIETLIDLAEFFNCTLDFLIGRE